MGDVDWMAQILDLTWRTLPTFGANYRFPRDEAGQVHYGSLRGPKYLRGLRRLALDLGIEAQIEAA